MTRRAARRAAVELLYAAELRGCPVADLLEDDADPYVGVVTQGVETDRAALDERLGTHAHRWSVERMSAIDRNVLRVALWEMRSGEVPHAVAIDEAVRLAKRYSGTEAGSFVNGVLDACRKALQTDG